MKKRILLGLIALAFMILPLRAADVLTVDSLLQRYASSPALLQPRVANQLMKIFHDEEIMDELLTFGEHSHPDSVSQQVYYWAAEFFYAYQDYERCEYYGKKAEPLCVGSEVEPDQLNLMSLVYLRMSKYNQAADYAKRCYKLDEKSGDPDLMSSSLNTLAGIYIGANQPKEAEQYILKGIEMARKADNPARMAVLQGMASEVYHALGQDAEALKYINEACELERQLGRQDKLAVRTTQRASVLIGLHHYEEAERDLGDAITFMRTTPDRHSLGIALNKMGMAILQQYREQDALPYFQEAADIFMEMGDLGNEMHSRRGLYECLRKTDSDAAHCEIERFDLLKDSLYSHATAESLARFNAEFGADWLKRENSEQRRQMWIIAGCCLLLAVLLAVGVWFYMHRRQRMRENALQVIIEQLRSNPTSVSDVEGRVNENDRNLLNQIVDYIKSQMSQGNLSIESLARQMCISRGQLNRRVKAITGVTTQQFALQVRLEHARMLLQEHPEMTIAEVGYQCGFEDATSFSRAFRRSFGQSPKSYKNGQ